MRLNRFIPSPIKFITLTSHVVHYKILGDSSFFFYNHPGSSLINLSTNLQRGSSWRVDARFLQEAKEPIKALWEASPPPQMPFFTKLRNVAQVYKQLCFAKAMEARLEEVKLR